MAQKQHPQFLLIQVVFLDVTDMIFLVDCKVEVFCSECVHHACAGIPLVYELDENLKPIKHYYLASEEELKAAQDKVAAQGKAK